MIPTNATTNRRGRFQRGIAALGTSAALVAALLVQTMGIAPAHAATSPAATYRLGISLAHDEFNRTGSTLGSAFIGGRWETASPTGLLRLQSGAATWSGFTRGQTTHAWLPEVSALNAQVDAAFAFGLISRTLYGMSHRTVVRRQAKSDRQLQAALRLLRTTRSQEEALTTAVAAQASGRGR